MIRSGQLGPPREIQGMDLGYGFEITVKDFEKKMLALGKKPKQLPPTGSTEKLVVSRTSKAPLPGAEGSS